MACLARRHRDARLPATKIALISSYLTRCVTVSAVTVLRKYLFPLTAEPWHAPCYNWARAARREPRSQTVRMRNSSDASRDATPRGVRESAGGSIWNSEQLPRCSL